jgi:ABC-type Na+ efflux pump permease subunit
MFTKGQDVRYMKVERIIFGLLIIGGYLGIAFLGAILFRKAVDKESLQLTRDAMLTIGPLIGIIVKSIWETRESSPVSQPHPAEPITVLPAQPTTADGA